MTNYGNLKLILYYGSLINDIHAKHQQNYLEFAENIEYQYAVSMILIQIGELANKLTNDFKNYLPAIPWHYMRSLRNRLAHQYGSIDIDLTYTISTGEIKTITEQLKQIIRDFEKEYPEVVRTLKNED